MTRPDPQATSNQLSIRLFGPISAERGGVPLDRTRTRKELWLLAILAIRAGKPVDRDWLAGTLWPEAMEEACLANLRRSLKDLRRVLGPDAARITAPSARTVSFNADNAFVDVLEFDAAASRADEPSLRAAVELYSGPLLEGCLEEWAISERETREQSFLGALENLSAFRIKADDRAAASRYLRRAISIDPLQEHLHRDLMRCEARRGDFAAVTQTYRDLRLLLREQINSDPSAESAALFQELRTEGRERAGRARPVLPSVEPIVVSPRAYGTSAGTNLPQPLSSFIGREREITDTRQMLAKARLLTLTGAGGAGKTRLAVELARGLQDHYADGVWFVELAAITDGALVPHAVGIVLGMQEATGQVIDEMLSADLGTKNCLLVLDNCEHVVGACAQLVTGLLSRCAQVTVLATSREALGISGEAIYRVPSLSVPAEAGLLTADLVLASESGRLFVERGQASSADYRMTDQGAEAVAQICRRLDGIPLAIELAAARVRVLTVQQIAGRLDDRFRLLVGGNRSALPRQQTLRSLIDWSYDLLLSDERTMLNRLSVFAGGCSLEAAEAVCPGGGIDASEVLDLLTALTDKSLLIKDEQNDEARFRLLETIRQYSAVRLQDSGEAEGVRARHLAHFAQLAEMAAPELIGPNQVRWYEALERDHDNLRTALDFAREYDRISCLRMAANLWRFWYTRGYVREGQDRIESALTQDISAQPSLARATALFGLAGLVFSQGDQVKARQLLDECRSMRKGLGDRRGEAQATLNLSVIARATGEYGLARSLISASLEFSRAEGDKHQIGRCLLGLGTLANDERDFDTALKALQGALDIAEELGVPYERMAAQFNLGNTLLALKDYQGARKLFVETLAASRAMRTLTFQSSFLDSCAELAAALGDHERCVTLLGALSGVFSRQGLVAVPDTAKAAQALLEKSRAALGTAAFDAAWERGLGMSADDAVDYSLAE